MSNSWTNVFKSLNFMHDFQCFFSGIELLFHYMFIVDHFIILQNISMSKDSFRFQYVVPNVYYCASL